MLGERPSQQRVLFGVCVLKDIVAKENDSNGVNAVQAHQSQTGKTFLCVGSSGDFGHNAPCLASFNLVFQPDDALRDAYRRWFEYLRRRASPLTAETTAVPHLVPAHGASDAAELWRDFQRLCSPTSAALVAEPIVDPETGEVTAPDGHAGPPAWDGDRTALDPLARELQRVYAEGALVTVDESTRVKPLAIPVKATLLGQAAERSVGALKHKQSFKLEVLDDAKGKEVEKCRKATDVIDLLSFLLSKGNRWIPTPAKALLDKELEARNARGLTCLGRIVGQSIDDYVKRREPQFAKDLNDMYRALGQGDSVPEDKLQAVLRDVKARLARPSETRITPRAVYNRIAPPDLTSSAADDNWSQPFSLLHRAARLFRESLTDPYFPRKLSGLSFTQQEFDATLDVFGDSILKDRNTDRAKAELVTLRDIEASDMPFRAKCHAVWEMIKGAAAAQRATS